MSALEEASNVVNGDRQKFYGHPLDNHTATATMWATYLSRKYGIAMTLTPEDVCWLNILQKVSREANAEKYDNIVDVIGYAANVEMVQAERAKRATKTE